MAAHVSQADWEPWQMRIHAELEQLDERIKNLKWFIGSPEFYTDIDNEDRLLLQQQVWPMERYAEVLRKRCERWAR